ncbi:MAG: hypothetical protein F4X72_12550 [Dehalococcoidia bacterium]|nr:hypothetical protein [Dehalococcoidia bacterium]
MRSLTEVYPPFKDQVDFYAVAFNESLNELQTYQNDSGHAGTVARSAGNMIRDFRVTQQSTKIAIDANGVIIYRVGLGRGGASEWTNVFQKLANSAQ